MITFKRSAPAVPVVYLVTIGTGDYFVDSVYFDKGDAKRRARKLTRQGTYEVDVLPFVPGQLGPAASS